MKSTKLYTPASEKVRFQVTRYCGLTGHGMMNEKANTMVRQRNKEKKKAAVRQWVSLTKPKPSLQLFFFSSVADGAVPISAPSSPLFRGSPSVALPVASIVASFNALPAHGSTQQGKELTVKPHLSITLVLNQHQNYKTLFIFISYYDIEFAVPVWSKLQTRMCQSNPHL